MKKIFAILIITCLTGCVASVNQKNLGYMADLTLCEQQKFNSDQLTLPWGLRYGGRSLDSIQSDLKLLSGEINNRGIDCPKILSAGSSPERKNGQSKIVNCFPNQATGGVTCL